MSSILSQVIWVLRRAGRCAKRSAQYYYDHPDEAWENLVTYAQENPKEFTLTCLLVAGGILVIVLPLAIGFGPAGPILGSIAAGWQSGIGAVAAGSAFAIIQSMAMTGAFAAIGGTMIGVGLNLPLLGWLFRRLCLAMTDFSTVVGALIGAGLLPPTMGHVVLPFIAPPNSLPTYTNGLPEPAWFLDAQHTEVGGDAGLLDRRTFITNSRETFSMVWDDLDVVTEERTVEEHALLGFPVLIQLCRPRRARWEDGFCERFLDHETRCGGGCGCVGDVGDLQL